MNEEFYRQEISRLATEYNKYRTKRFFVVIVLVVLFFWLGTLIWFLLSDKATLDIIIFSVGSGITFLLLIGFMAYIIYIQYKRMSFLKTKIFELIAKILYNESHYEIKALVESPVKILRATPLLLKNDIVSVFTSFQYKIKNSIGKYFLQMTTRQSGKSSTLIYFGEIITFAYDFTERVQLRTKRDYNIRKYRFWRELSSLDNFVYLHKDSNFKGDLDKEIELLRSLSKLYPHKTKCGIAFEDGKIYFFADNKLKIKAPKSIDYDGFKNLMKQYISILERIEMIIGVVNSL